MSEVKVEITANTSALSTGLAKAQKNIDSFGKDVQSKITDKLAGAFSAAGVIGGIGVLAAGVISSGKAIMNFAGNLQDASEAMGLTVEKLQGLHGAFMLGGASAEDVDKGISKLLQNMDTATTSVGPIRDAFDKLGVSFETISSGDPNAVILAIADGVKNAKNPTEAYAAVLELLGKSGKKMMAGLKEGGDGLDELSKRVKKLSNEDAESIAKFGDAVDVLKGKLMVLGSHIALPVFDLLNVAMDDTKSGIERFMAFVKAQSPAYFIAKKLGMTAPDPVKPSSTIIPGIPDIAPGEGAAAVDPKITANLEATAKIKEEELKLEQEYNAKIDQEAQKLGDAQISNAEEIEKHRRDQLTTEGQINALLEDRKNLQSEIASSSGKQKVAAQKDLISVEKELATAKDKAKKDMAAEGDEREKNNAADMKKKEDAVKKKKDLAEAQVKGAADIADAQKATKLKQDDLLGQMAEEEMKAPQQRANEDRREREKERIKDSLRRRIDKEQLSGRSSKALAKLVGEFENTEKDLPKEVEKLTVELKKVVERINKG